MCVRFGGGLHCRGVRPDGDEERMGMRSGRAEDDLVDEVLRYCFRYCMLRLVLLL